MKLPTHGGTLLRPTSGGILIVSAIAYPGCGLTLSLVAITALQQTVRFLTQGGRFRQAADREKEIGQIYLQEFSQPAKACESFLRAAEWYSEDDATAYVYLLFSMRSVLNGPNRTANGCFKDAADLLAEIGDYHQAITLYERVADHSLTSNLTKYSVKDYWLKAGLCCLAANVSIGQALTLLDTHLLQDGVAAKQKKQKYITQDPSFASTREAKLIDALAEAMEQDDVEAYTSAVVEFDQVMRLDNWKTNILLKVKRNLGQDEPGLV